ncbi:hypothetical protein EYR36_003583 [Pleurotus pulmonarius]|nr:hypothetical protein EYR36_003583 [Pleurotus pulmonarius]
MRPGWLDCDEQYEYLKAHVQGFEDTMKDPLARRSWNAAFNQGWEEKWALGKTLRKNIGSWFRQQLIWRGTYEVVHFTMARFGHENGSSATSRKRRYLEDQPKATADPPAPSQENGSSTTSRNRRQLRGKAKATAEPPAPSQEKGSSTTSRKRRQLRGKAKATAEPPAPSQEKGSSTTSRKRRQLRGKAKATADPPAPSQENGSSTTSRERRQLRGKAKATADFPAPSPQRSPPGGTSSRTLARSSKVNRSSGKSRQNQRSGGQPKAAADPPASSVPLARHQYLRSPGLASQNVGSSCQGAAEESGPAEQQDPAKHVPPFVASALFALAKLSVMNQSPPLATQSPRSRPSSRRKADAKALPSNEACVVSPRVCKPTVYKQVAYGKLFLTWDLPGFCNSDVVVAIQGRRISVLASRQAVATVFEWEEEQDCTIDINHIQCGMSCGRLRLAALMKAQEACDATHDSGRFEVSVGPINSTAPGLSVSSVSRHPFTSHRAIQVNPQEPAPGPEDSAVATSRAQEGDEPEIPTRELEADSTRPESAATSTPTESDGLAKAATQCLTTANFQEGDESQAPPRELEDDSARLASAPTVTNPDEVEGLAMAISRPLNTTNVQEGLEPWTPVQGLEARTSSAKVPYFKRNQHSRTPAITIVWYASCGVIRLPLPPAAFNSEAPPAQYDLFIHTVGTEHQVWIWDEGAWKPIELGYSIFLKGMIRFLIIKNGKPSWVQKDTYLKRSHKS